MRILVVGPDGAGKSTVLDGVVDECERLGLRVRRVHFDPSTVPNGTKAVRVTEPHAQRARRPAGQVAAVVKRWVQYSRASRGDGRLSRDKVDILFQERGWYDQVVDPRRYRMTGLGQRVARLLGPLTPKHDGVLQLHGDPFAIVARKPELSESEVQRQIAAWSDILANRSDVARIDTVAQTVDAAVREVVSVVASVRASRIAGVMRPVLAVPSRLQMLASSSKDDAVDALYSPLSTVGRISRRFPAVRARSVAAKHQENAGRVGRVIADLGIAADDLAMIRSLGREQAIIAVRRREVTTEFARLRWGRAGTNDVEAAILQSVSDIEGVRVPVVLDNRMVDDVSVMRLSAVSQRQNKPQFVPEVALEVSVALRWACDGRGVTHGDLTLWNLFNHEKPALIDWEKASASFWAGEDLLYYLRHETGIHDVPTVDQTLEQHAGLFESYAKQCDLDLDLMLENLRRNVAGARR